MSKSYAKQKAKEFAGNLFNKLSNVLDQKDDDSRPPTPPPKPSNPMPPVTFGSTSGNNNLADSFQRINLNSPTPPASGGGFVGGFHPAYSLSGNVNPPPFNHASSEPPPKMPLPSVPGYPAQSLTMQMALQPEMAVAPARPSSAPSAPFTPNELEELRPHFTPSKPKPTSSKPLTPAPAPVAGTSKPSTPRPGASKASKPAANTASASKPVASKPSTPQRPTKPSTASSSGSDTPSTPSAKDGQVRCAGTTKAGKQCTRLVKVAPALSQRLDGEDDSDTDDTELERFCFQHTKELLGPSGCYARKNGEWFNFDDWIPSHLQVETQLSLRIEMERARSQSDVDGYIYTFEIREEGSDLVKLKVGRAVNLVKRIDQWGKQCGSKEQVLRGFYPNPEDDHKAPTSLMKGKVKAGEKSACCHRLERLIHLELADLSVTQVHMDPDWPDVGSIDVSSQVASGKRIAHKKAERCLDCGTMHKEIFEFKRWVSGPHKNKEWEKIVKPVIERWGMFVELYL